MKCLLSLSLNLLMDGLEVVNKIWLIKPLLITRIIIDFARKLTGKDWSIVAKIDTSYQFDILNDNQTILSDAYNETTVKFGHDSRVLVGARLAFELGKNTRVGIDYERSFGGKYNIDNELNLKVRYSF